MGVNWGTGFRDFGFGKVREKQSRVINTGYKEKIIKSDAKEICLVRSGM